MLCCLSSRSWLRLPRLKSARHLEEEKKGKSVQIPAGASLVTCRLLQMLQTSGLVEESHLASRAYASVTSSEQRSPAARIPQGAGQTERLPSIHVGLTPTYLGASYAEQGCAPPPNQRCPRRQEGVSTLQAKADPQRPTGSHHGTGSIPSQTAGRV